jgi:BirA family biotin operon repressor/biotin-[acetyl-CoA-carboxylase] ligase
MEKKLIPKTDLQNNLIQNLKTDIIGKNVFYFNKIHSTNLHAKQLIKENIEEGTIVISDVQTKGRGRKDRFWHSPIGGLWFSIVLYPNLSSKSGMLITMTASISIAQAIKEVVGLDAEIKWPNDLLIKNKKVCGILTEIDADLQKIKYAIVGIGINVNNKIEDDLKNTAISLKQEIDKKISKVNFLKSVLEKFDSNYIKLKNKNFNYIRKTWLTYANIINKKIKITEENNVTIGIVKEIDEYGHLILNTKFDKVKIISGDVKYI